MHTCEGAVQRITWSVYLKYSGPTSESYQRVIDETLNKSKAARGRDAVSSKHCDPEQPSLADSQWQPSERQWISSLPQVASEDDIHIGNGRYAHFRRDRRFAQVQVTFTAPQGVDPNPGRELTDEFKNSAGHGEQKSQKNRGYTNSINPPQMIPPLAVTAATHCTNSSC